MNNSNAPKVFISYSWKPETNKQKVIELSERLFSDGVIVIMDIYNLEEGQDKYKFMEKMVNDSEVKKVLIICNKSYKEKADKRIGGVGEESLILSPEIYKEVEQTKFIPIVFEIDENGKPFLPTYLESRIFINLSDTDIYGSEYEKLLRNIYNKPYHKPPPLGNPPDFILSEKITYLRTSHQVKEIKSAIKNNSPLIKSLVKNYFGSFLDSLNDFKIDTNNNELPFDDVVYNKIEEMKVLRDDFLELIDLFISSSNIFEYEIIKNFFEDFYNFISNLKIIYTYEKDHFAFLLYEIFIYTITILLKNDRFKDIYYLLNTPYFLNENSGKDYSYYISFRPYLESLEQARNQRLGNRRLSVTADMLKGRINSKFSTSSELVETDIFLFFYSLNFYFKNEAYMWFPYLSVYNDWSANLKFFKRAISKTYFDKIKVMFDVNTRDEFIAQINSLKEDEGYKKLNMGYGFKLPSIDSFYNINNLCKLI